MIDQFNYDLLRPGYQDSENVLDTNWPRLTFNIIEFMQKHRRYQLVLDVGWEGYKSKVLGQIWDIQYINAEDFNFDKLTCRTQSNKAMVITCFETLEHVQNPLFLMRSILDWLEPGGSIYLSTPGRPRMFWPKFHYNELSPDYLQKWILNPLQLQIVRKKKATLNDSYPWWWYFTGIRPFLRIWMNYTWLYEIKHK